MATPTDPTDPTQIDTSQIDALGTAATRVADIMAGLLNTVNDVYASLSKVMGRQATDNAKGFGSAVSGIGDAFERLKSNIGALEKINTDTVVLRNEMGELAGSLDNVMDKFVGLGQFMSRARMFDQFSTDSASAINTVDTSVTGLQESLKSLGLNVPVPKSLTALFENAAQSEKLENTYISLAASTGKLDSIFTDEITTLKDLSGSTSEYVDVIGRSADATGFSVKQALSFAATLGKIPGVIDSNVDSFTSATETTSGLTEAMKLMSGSGRGMEDVAHALTTAYEDLGQAQGTVAEGAQKGSEFFATISQTANVLKLRFNDVRDVLTKVADEFKFVGDNTDAAARVLGRYTDALRSTGLTSKASTEIIQGMVKAVGDLSIGQKALLSSRSGGPGGLQGAFQIEQLLRQGKLDQVVQMAENSLKKQFGGRIYTQEEAAQSPQAASQFMRQRSLLQSGVLGIGGGTSNDQATRLLEALKAGNLGTVRSITTGQDALREVTDRGSAIQERSFNELKRLNNFSEKTAVASELMAGATVKGLFGSTGANADNLREASRMAGSEAGRLNEQRATGAKTDMIDNLIRMGRDAISQGVGAGKGVAGGVGAGVKQAGQSIVSLVNEARNLTGERETEVPQRSIQAASTRGAVLQGSVRPNVIPTGIAATRRATEAATQTAQDTASIRTATQQSDMRLKIDITAPDGFDVVATSDNTNVQPDINRKSINNAGSWPARR